METFLVVSEMWPMFDLSEDKLRKSLPHKAINIDEDKHKRWTRVMNDFYMVQQEMQEAYGND